MNRYDTATASGRTIPPTPLENRVKRSITIDPTIGSLSNIFHEFLKALFNGVAWNRYDMLTASGRPIPLTALENRVKMSITIYPIVGSLSNVFTSFRGLFSMELRGIGTTRRRRPVEAIPPTVLENRVKRSITIDPTVGSRSNFFHEFPEAVFDGVAWNLYETLTASGRGHSNDSAREPGQKVHNYRSDRWIALKFFSWVSGGCG